MAAEKASALVLRVVDFSETSLVVTLLTREFGKVRGLAKGGRRLKGPFESALDLLAQCRIVFLRKSSDSLDLLTEARLERRFRPPGRQLSHLYAAYYVAELLDALTHEDDPHPELFDLACATLDALAQPQTDAGVTTLRMELGALHLLGHLPALHACVECGRPLDRTARVALSVLGGGALCSACRPGKRHVVSLSPHSARWIERWAPAPAAEMPSHGLDAPNYGELRGLLTNYLSHLLGYRPKTLAYLNL